MNNLFLTGKIGVGKSTLLKKILEEIDLSIGGYITEKRIEEHIKTFTIRSLYNYIEKYPIAKVDRRTFSKEIFIDNFKYGITSTLDKSLKNRDLIVMDELGFMEQDIDPFTSKVFELLDSNKIILGVLKDYDCHFLNSIRARDDVLVIEITEKNRNYIYQEIIDMLKDFGVPFKKTTSFSWSKDRIDWYNDALEHPKNAYPYAFLKEIKKYTGSLAGKKTLDIGAGTGAFAIPLLKEGAHVTAIDSSFHMIHSLVDRTQEYGLENLNCIISPFHRAKTNRHDISISAFSGGSTKTIEGIIKMKDLTNEYCFIISSFENQDENFKRDILYKRLDRPIHKQRTHKGTLADTLRMLDCLEYIYDYKEIEYEFSQYFLSFDEALTFFMDRFHIDVQEEKVILKEFLKEFLIAEHGEYVFKNIKKSYIISIESKF